MQSVLNANVRLSRATERYLHLPTEATTWRSFTAQAADLVRVLPDGAVAVDLGGGRMCRYAKEVQPPGRIRLIAVDISAAELALNADVAETYVADVAKMLPLPDSSADLILSCALLEHVDGVPAAIREMGRVLRPGAVTMHLVPCRYSLFGMAARLLPFRPLLWLTLKLAPWFKEQAFGFKVYYDQCYPSALEREFRAAGFATVEQQVSWACEDFFTGIYPVYLLHAAYEQMVRRLGLRQMSAYSIVKAVR